MNTFLYINIYILTFKAMSNCQCFSELGLHAKQKMFLECFFSPSLEQKERKRYEQKKKTLETFEQLKRLKA